MTPKIGDRLHKAHLSGIYIMYDEWEVTALTPKGFWLGRPYCGFQTEKTIWRPNSTRSVHRSKEGALRSLYYRKRAHSYHSIRRLSRLLRGTRHVIDKCMNLGIKGPIEVSKDMEMIKECLKDLQFIIPETKDLEVKN